MYEHIEQLGEEMTTGVPAGMTLGFWLAELVKEDREKAEALYAAEAAKYDGPKLAEWKQHYTIDELNKSANYVRHVEHFIKVEGKLSRSMMRAFNKVRNDMISRVIAATDALFVNCNNAGSKVVRENLRPTLIFVDEAGQASLPTFCVPLMAFKVWQAVLLYGAPKQLGPTSTAGLASEVSPNAKLSPLSVLMSKKFPHITLDFCYRMCPAILQLPSDHYYDGRLKCADSAKKDNGLRERMRAISTDYYGLLEGSEFWVVDVVEG